MSGNGESVADLAQEEKERRSRMKKTLTLEEKRVQKMRAEFVRMGIKPDFWAVFAVVVVLNVIKPRFNKSNQICVIDRDVLCN